MQCPKCRGLAREMQFLSGGIHITGISCFICGYWVEIVTKPKIDHFPGPLEGRPDPSPPGYKGCGEDAREYFRTYRKTHAKELRIKRIKRELAALEAVAG